jgi:hypothetical protein
MAYAHFTLTTPTIAYFKVRNVPIDQRISYVDSTFVDWEHYWKAVASTERGFVIVMDISELKSTHSASREHMVKRLKKLNETYPGAWAGVAIVATSMLTRGIATAYSWFASIFPGVALKVFGNSEEATQWARALLETAKQEKSAR